MKLHEKVNILKQFKKKEIWRQVVKFRLGWNRFALCDSRFHFRKNHGVPLPHRMILKSMFVKKHGAEPCLLWARNCKYICVLDTSSIEMHWHWLYVVKYTACRIMLCICFNDTPNKTLLNQCSRSCQWCDLGRPQGRSASNAWAPQVLQPL